MPYRSIQTHLKPSFEHKLPKSSPDHDRQHGQLQSISLLLDIPAESLTHVTSFIDPPSLLSLSRVNKILYEHVKDDNTWYRAFVYQFLDIPPESDLHDPQILLLRRSASTWKTEFITRYNLRRRWERSRNATTTHTPHHSPITSMHLMPSHGLLTSSLQYGIVSRSVPLTGRVLKGYLDASGTGPGIGNPNAEFSPNVTACALSSDGGTAKILWGFRHGEVAVMTANKAMDGIGKTAAKLVRCKVEDEHEGAVLAVVWGGANGTGMVTSGADGRVKLWDAKTVKCLWTSEKKGNTFIPDPCTKIAVALAKGIIVGTRRSGEIVIWSGLEQFLVEDVPYLASAVMEIRMPSPIPPSRDDRLSTLEVTLLALDLASSTQINILTAYSNHAHFYRHCVDMSSHQDLIEPTPFGDPASGSISSVMPVFSRQPGDSSFVIVGDAMGCVSIYDWSAVPPASMPTYSVLPFRKFEAYEDGAAVTALAWNSVTLVTGSSRGTMKVWDSLTLGHLRSFASVPRQRTDGDGQMISDIVLGPEKQVVVAAVGSRVMAWMAGAVGKNERGGVRGRNIGGKKARRERAGAAKYHQHMELCEAISESRRDLEEEGNYVRRAYGREREQMARLEGLGLDEVEAVEYVLMVSRDEEEARRRNSPSRIAEEEGVFEGDFDDIPPPVSPLSSTPSSRRSSHSNSSIFHGYPSAGRPIPLTYPPTSNHKVQVSPRVRPEPTEAGMSPSSSHNAAWLSSSSHLTPVSSPSPTLSTSPSDTRRSVSGSPQSVRPGSAWNTPLRTACATPSPSPGSSAPAQAQIAAPRSNWGASNSVQAGSGLSLSRAGSGGLHEEMDEDLKFAIELSLVEARSRGENI